VAQIEAKRIIKERSKFMADENPKVPNQQSARTLKDDEIVTDRKFSRRSFVTVAGTLLAGGAAFLVAGSAANAQDQKENKDQATDPDKQKDDSSKEKQETKEAAADPDKTKKDKKHKDKNKDTKKDKNKDQATDPDKPKS
jgi:hypothetical protein